MQLLFSKIFCLPWTDLISVLASLATCISAVIALVALRQIKKQRESSYRPELFLTINQSDIVIKGKKQEDSSIEYRQFINDVESDYHAIFFSIENIGLAAAKEVSVLWKFNFNKAFQMVSDACPAEVGLPKDGYLEIKNSKGDTFVSLWLSVVDVDPTRYDFVLPRSQEKFNLGCSVPNEITDLFVVYAINKMGLLDDKELAKIYREEFQEFPEVEVEVSYRDIGNGKHHKRFKVDFEISTGIIEEGTKLKDFKELVMSIYSEVNQLK